MLERENLTDNIETTSANFEDVSLSKFHEIVSDGSLHKKCFSTTIVPPRQIQLSINKSIELQDLKASKLYYFSDEVFISSPHSVVFDLDRKPYVETLYEGIKNEKNIGIDRFTDYLLEMDESVPTVLSSARWQEVHFHKLIEGLFSTFIEQIYNGHLNRQYILHHKIHEKQSTWRDRVLSEKCTIVDRGLIKTKNVLATNLLYTRNLFPPHLKLFSTTMANGVVPTKRTGEKIYCTRGDNTVRCLKNKKQVEAFFSGFGFSIVDFANLSASEQIETIQNAQVIVGPHGANLTNCIFARPGTLILELQQLHRASGITKNQNYAIISHVLNCDYSRFTPENEPLSDDWEVDLIELVEFLKEYEIYDRVIEK